MGRPRNTKRISWAINLCQVRLFSSSLPPSNSILPSQSFDGPDDDGPPGFQRPKPAYMRPNPAYKRPIKLTTWRCPPKFEVDKQWQVAAGEESSEIKTQNLRETRAIEVHYPSRSTIPRNPRVFKDVEDSVADDLKTPVVRTTPIENDAVPDTPVVRTTPIENGAVPDTPVVRTTPIENDAVANTPVVRTTPTKNDAAAASATDRANLIDYNLLAKLLSNPKLVQDLISRPSSALNVPSITADSAPPGFDRTNTAFRNVPSITADSAPPGFDRTNTAFRNVPSITADSAPPGFDRTNTAFRNVPSITADSAPPGFDRTNTAFSGTDPAPYAQMNRPVNTAPVAKDASYYRSLIQQYGREERQHDVVPANQFVQSRSMKRGNCAYPSAQLTRNGVVEVHSVKRVKLN